MASTSIPQSSIIFKITNIPPATTIGLGYLGVAFSSALYGITCFQTFFYYKSQSAKAAEAAEAAKAGKAVPVTDRPWYKGLVALVFILDTVHQALVTFTFYHYLIDDFANPIALFLNIWAVPTSIVCVTLIGTLVYAFMTHRVWGFSEGNRWVAGICLVWMVGMLGINLVYPIKQFSLPIIALAQEGLETIGIASLCVSVAGDAFMAALITTYIIKKWRDFSRDSDATRANDVLSKIGMLTVGTGALTTCFELANLIAYLLAPLTLFNLFFNIMLSKLYANSLLTLLNTRDYINKGFSKNKPLTKLVNGELASYKSGGLQVNHSTPPIISVIVSQNLGVGSFLTPEASRDREDSESMDSVFEDV